MSRTGIYLIALGLPAPDLLTRSQFHSLDLHLAQRGGWSLCDMNLAAQRMQKKRYIVSFTISMNR